MILKTIESDILNLSYNEVCQLINDITYKDYWDKERNKLETPTQKNNRIQWILNDFPTYKKLSEQKDTSSESYIENTAKTIGWTLIKQDLQTLYSLKEGLEKEEKRKQINNKHLELWDIKIQGIELDLKLVNNEKVRITKKLQQDNFDDTEREKLMLKLNFLSSWEEDLGKDLGRVQKNQRTALGLTNNYKDPSPDKMEIEQTGELTVNQNIVDDGLTEEERRQEYEAEFTRLLQEATTTPKENAQDIQGNNNR